MQLIVAVDQNWAIGREGDQLVYIPADLKRFKTLTTGHAVILGRRTLATFPGGRVLPARRNLVLSRNTDFHPEGAEVFLTLESLLEAAPASAFVIGGGSVYRALLPLCQTALNAVPSVVASRGWNQDVDQHYLSIGQEHPYGQI